MTFDPASSIERAIRERREVDLRYSGTNLKGFRPHALYANADGIMIVAGFYGDDLPISRIPIDQIKDASPGGPKFQPNPAFDSSDSIYNNARAII